MTAFVEDLSVLQRKAALADLEVRYGELSEQVADVRYGKFLSGVSANHRPLILMIHGGFWRPQYDRHHTAPMCAALADAGWTNVSIEYRRVPGQPNLTIDDVSAAVTKLPSQIPNHNGRVIVMGHSAGGHLCLYVLARATNLNVIGGVALAPAADLEASDALNLGNGAVKAFLGCDPKQRIDLDPSHLPSPKVSVTIVHGVQDQIVPLSVAESYMSNHPTAKLLKLDACGHFAVIDPLTAAWQIILAELRALQ